MLDDKQIELWISQYLDGQLDPTAAECLSEQLAADDQTRQRLEKWFTLHQAARQTVPQAVQRGKSFDQIFAAACQQTRRAHRWAALRRWGRFAAGLAAGILVALSAQVSAPKWAYRQQTTPSTAGWAMPSLLTTFPEMHDIDYYDYTDSSGARWLLEIVRQPISSQPVVYYQDL